MRFFISLFSLALMLFAVIFAVSNRYQVPLGLWPFPFTLETPVFLISFVFFLCGFVCGWFNYFFFTRTKQAAEIKDLRKKVRYLREHSVLATQTQDVSDNKASAS